MGLDLVGEKSKRSLVKILETGALAAQDIPDNVDHGTVQHPK